MLAITKWTSNIAMRTMLLQAQTDAWKTCIQPCTSLKSKVRHEYGFTYPRHMWGTYTETEVSIQRILSASLKCSLLNTRNILRARHIMCSSLILACKLSHKISSTLTRCCWQLRNTIMDPSLMYTMHWQLQWANKTSTQTNAVKLPWATFELMRSRLQLWHTRNVSITE